MTTDSQKTKRISKLDMQIATALMLVCVLFAYWFLFFDNNADVNEGTLTKLAAVLYFVAVSAIGLIIGAFNVKSILFIIGLCGYMVVNYIIFGMGIKDDLTAIVVIMTFIIAKNLSRNFRYAKIVYLASLFLFLVILLLGRFEGVYIHSPILHKMQINANTMAQLVLINIFTALLLTNEPKYWVINILIYAAGMVLLYLCKSRTAMVCGAILCLGHLFSRKMKAASLYKIFIWTLILSVLAVIVYAYVLPLFIPKDFSIFGKHLFTGRQVIYVSVINDIFTSPLTALFGFGHVTFGLTSQGVPMNTHNFWLQLWLQYGVIVMIIALVLFVKMTRALIGRTGKNANLYLIYCICLVLFCMLETPLMGRTMVVLFLFPLIIGYDGKKKSMPIAAARKLTERNSMAVLYK